MKKLLRIVLVALAAIGILSLCGLVGLHLYFDEKANSLLAEAGPAPGTVAGEHREFRDLNKNGRLDPYEDMAQATEVRVEDLLQQMTLEEKAGLMFFSMVGISEDGSLLDRPSPSQLWTLVTPGNTELVLGRLINHFSVAAMPGAREMARWHNNMQRLAERTRLGIPVTLAADPAHGFQRSQGANTSGAGFSTWPEPIGLAAARDTGLVRMFGDIARQEYRAVGIHVALHPMADLATDPRWARMYHTFGEDAKVASAMTRAYVLGFQGDTLGPHSVATMTKHFAGGGPQEGGFDAHFPYGRFQVYPGDNFDYHLIPFEQGAFPAGTAQIMPYYGVPVGQTSEDVGFAFNRDIIRGLLRDRYGFDGVVCTDWGLLTSVRLLGRTFFEAPAWGVQHLSPSGRIMKALEAGVDQFGGEYRQDLLIALVQSGQLEEARLDTSARRILLDKFRLGLFDDPFVDEDAAPGRTGTPAFVAAGVEAQRRSLVLLKNGTSSEEPVLPLNSRPRLYLENVDPGAAEEYADVVSRPEQADFALIRLTTPFQTRKGSYLESLFHQGDLDFKGEERTRILTLLDTVPTIVDIHLERAAVIPDIARRSAALIADFGASDSVVLELVFGRFSPAGRLPLELPSSMEAVRAQKEDVPYDSVDPLFPFDFGMSYIDRVERGGAGSPEAS